MDFLKSLIVKFCMLFTFVTIGNELVSKVYKDTYINETSKIVSCLILAIIFVIVDRRRHMPVQ